VRAGAATLVVGVGNPDRGDDAAGPVVAARVAALGLPGMDVVEQTDPVGLLTLLDRAADRDLDHDVVVVVDAVAPAGRPGRIHVHRLDQAGVAPGSGGTSGSHGLDVADVVALARALGRCPQTVVLVGVEGECFEAGRPLSGPVSAALPAAVEATVAAVRRGQSQGIHTLSQ